ncbi:substrate-binding periplasmic protein [Geomonas agri]|uniref:substrate-binding periplasmic protein n=1 Tax=Geomonas agri TaxID=2873702 RepID=UPI001CD2D8D6|nr:transporter substrate-binding domain-containing protein [Geomonas agri]
MNVSTMKACLVLTVLLSPALAGAAPVGCTSLVYSANPQYPPFHWAAGKGFEGASIELLSLALPKGVTARPVVYPWKRVLYLAEQGGVDLVVSLRKTPEREKFLVFTEHRSFPNPAVVFVRKDRTFPMRSWQDLKGHKGAISLGDSFGEEFDRYRRKELDIKEANTVVENLRRLDAGNVDYFITGKYPGTYYLDRIGNGRIVSLDTPVTSRSIYFAFSRKSPCASLVDEVSRHLEELERDGTADKLLEKYMKFPTAP